MNYLDETRVGIWGWGYGGYVTAMVLGAQQTVYKCGVSVSPITDWLFYSKFYSNMYRQKFYIFYLQHLAWNRCDRKRKTRYINFMELHE